MTFISFLIASMFDVIIVPTFFVGLLTKTKTKAMLYGVACGLCMFVLSNMLHHVSLPLAYSLAPKLIAGVIWSLIFFKLTGLLKWKKQRTS
jgi:hypothetical protein